MKILITGSEGFVGKKLQNSFISNNDIILLDRVNSEKNNYFKHDLAKDDYSYLVNKLSNKSIDYIIHLAAAKGDFNLSADDFYVDNVKATENLIKIINLLKIKNVIHYSTVSVYGHNNQIKSEQANLNPNNPYGKTKLSSENLFLKWFNSNPIGKSCVILRPSVIYGDNNFANMYNLMKLLSSSFPILVGNGDYVKSIISLNNLIDITHFCINNIKGLEIFNCTDEPYPKLNEVIDFICSVEGFNKPLINIPYNFALLLAKPFDLFSKFTNIDIGITSERVYKFATPTDFRSDKLRAFGYIQKYNTKEEIIKMANWFKNKNL